MKAMFKLLSENARMPSKAHDDDVGFDLYALEKVFLNHGMVTKVRTGIAYGGLDPLSCSSSHISVFPKIEGRSGLALQGIFPVGGIVDPGFRGELVVMLYNSIENDIVCVLPGDRIAQLVFYTTAQPALEIGELKPTERGSKGFGSTGR